MPNDIPGAVYNMMSGANSNASLNIGANLARIVEAEALATITGQNTASSGRQTSTKLQGNSTALQSITGALSQAVK